MRKGVLRASLRASSSAALPSRPSSGHDSEFVPNPAIHEGYCVRRDRIQIERPSDDLARRIL